MRQRGSSSAAQRPSVGVGGSSRSPKAARGAPSGLDGRGAAPRVYERFTVGPGIIGWVFRYTNREAVVRRNAVSAGLELSAQLAGHWVHQSAVGGQRALAPSETFALSPTERYGYSYSAPEGEGVQVGFLLYPEENPRLTGLGGLPQVAPGAFDADRLFAGLCGDVARQVERGEPLDAGGLASELLAVVERRADVVPHDPLLRAERALMRHLDRPLYLRHIADVAGMLPDTFYRAFNRRFGMGPIRYRLVHRLNAVARLVWSRPDLTLVDIAAMTGFDDMSYLHRSFRAHFGLSPALYGLRLPDAPGAAARG
jgi:AraC-like DNA-binding protein